jgi:hypothetical protein
MGQIGRIVDQLTGNTKVPVLQKQLLLPSSEMLGTTTYRKAFAKEGQEFNNGLMISPSMMLPSWQRANGLRENNGDIHDYAHLIGFNKQGERGISTNPRTELFVDPIAYSVFHADARFPMRLRDFRKIPRGIPGNPTSLPKQQRAIEKNYSLAMKKPLLKKKRVKPFLAWVNSELPKLTSVAPKYSYRPGHRNNWEQFLEQQESIWIPDDFGFHFTFD